MPKQHVVNPNDQALDRIVTKNWLTGRTRNGVFKSVDVTVLLSDGSVIYEVRSIGVGSSYYYNKHDAVTAFNDL